MNCPNCYSKDVVNTVADLMLYPQSNKYKELIGTKGVYLVQDNTLKYYCALAGVYYREVKQ